MNEHNALIALSENYKAVHIIDLENNSIVAVKTAPEIVELVGDGKDAQAAVYKFTEHFTAAESRNECRIFSDFSTLPERLQNQKRVSLVFRDMNNEWCRVSFVRLDELNPPGRVLYPIEDIDSQIQSENRINEMLSIFTESFATVCYVDKADHSFHLIRRNAFVEDDLMEHFEADNSLESMIHKYASTAVLAEDAAEFERYSNLSYVEEVLDRQERIYHTYRRVTSTGIKYYRLLIVPCDDGNGLLYGYENVDQEARAQIDRQKELLQKDVAMDLLLQMVRAGIWTMVYDSQKHPIKMTWNDDIRRHIGWSEEELPASFENWAKMLHPDDVDFCWKALNEFIEQEKEEYDCPFRYMTKHQGYRWYHCKARYEYTDEDGNRHYIGTFVDITDEKAKEELQRIRELEDKKLAAVYDMTGAARWQYKLQEDGSQYDLAWNRTLDELFGYADNGNNGLSVERWKQCITLEDREYVLRETRRFNQSSDIRYDLEYRIIDNHGDMRWIRAVARKVVGNHDIPSEVIGTSVDITARKRAEWRNKIIETLANEYTTVFEINLKEDTSIQYKDSGRTENIHDEIFRDSSFSGTSKAFIELAVDPKYQEIMRQSVRPDYIRQILATTGSYSTVFLSKDGLYTEMKIARIDNERIVMGFAVKDTEIRHEMRLREQLKIVDHLSNEYISLWVVDSADHSFRLIRNFAKSNTHEEAVEQTGAIGNYEEGMEAFFNTYVVPEDRTRFAEMTSLPVLRRLVTGSKVYPVEFRLLNDDGTISYCQVLFVKVDDGSEQPKFAYAYRDVNESTRRELQYRADVEKARDDALAATKAKSEFLANMSHDIRTPMNAIIGFTDMAERHRDDQDLVTDSLAKIKIASRQLLAIINDVLDMSKIESGHLEFSEEVISVQAAVDNIQSLFASMAASKNIELITNTDSVTHDLIICNRKVIDRIVQNIISNSIKFTEPNGRVQLKIEESGTNDFGMHLYRIIIEDNGIGMSEEFQKKIFDPFERERTSTVSQQQGTGLGMAIVKKLVDRLDGTITLESTQGVGSRFTIELPLALSDISIEDAVNTVEKDDNLSIAGKKLLVAEDIEINRIIIEMILKDQGVSLDLVENGKAAVDAFTSRPDYYDAILMDIQMPEMNGYEATRTIRAMDINRARTIPIIAMTANAFAEDRANAMNAGMNDHVAKPIDVKELCRAIYKHTNRVK